MKRREFITLIGGAAAWPVVARAQQSMPDRVRRIAMLIAGSETDPEAQRRIAVLLKALEVLGWFQARNIEVTLRWETTSVDKFRAHAQELVSLRPDLLMAISSTPAALAFKEATPSIPILFVNLTDPVASKLVETLARPNGNATGFTNFEYEMIGKWLEFLKELAPRMTRLGLLFNPVTAPHAQPFIAMLEPAAKRLSVELSSFPVRTTAAITSVFEAMGKDAGSGLIVVNEAFTSANRKQIIGLANQNKIPTIYPFRFFTTDDGLISYGVEQIDIFRRSATYVDRILKGEKPADLPVQQPTKFELVINMRTARALGLTVPPTLLARADEVIE